jgi:hypothetical protein
MPDSSNKAQDSVTPVQYIRWLFDPSEKLAILTRSRDRGETTQRITTAARATEGSFQNWLLLKNQKQSSDVYIGMNALRTDARARTKESVLAIRHLYLDLDHDAERSLATIEHSKLVPAPNVVLETSPDKLQLVWRVEGFGQDKAEAMLRSMARKFGADPAATDSTRVLRVPGFRNHKYDFDFTVTAKIVSDHRYAAHDFRLKTEPTDLDLSPSHIKKHDSGSSPRQALSQSEHDWAYAKRSLAKGVPAEEIITDIAAFRARDKHNPEDYARRTVNKAQAQLRASQLSTAEDSQHSLPPDRG